MKHRFTSLFFGLSGVLLAAAPAGAQISSFSSTSPPSPFNRFPSANASAQPSASQQAGQYPGGLPGSAVQGTTNNSSIIDPNHRLTRQDSLSYRVAEDRDDKVWPLVVQDSGEVDVPLIGRVKAAGKTTTELTSDIKAKLESEYYYHATVTLGLDRVAPHSGGRVYIMGEINGKGALDLPADGQLTVSQAILQMGGPTDDSDLKGVRIVRKNVNAKGYIVVNVAAVFKGDASKDVVLQPGDTVKVPRNLFGIHF